MVMCKNQKSKKPVKKEFLLKGSDFCAVKWIK